MRGPGRQISKKELFDIRTEPTGVPFSRSYKHFGSVSGGWRETRSVLRCHP